MLERTMQTKKVDEDELSSWLLPFTDMVVILMAFFAVSYTVSASNQPQAEKIQDSVQQAFSSSDEPTESSRYSQTEKLFNDIQQSLAGYEQSAQYQLLLRNNDLILIAPSALMFDSGSDHLTHTARSFIGQIAKVVRHRSFHIQVEGHTDSHPIQTPRFTSNWELSSARATRVVRQFISSAIAPKRLSAVGYADTQSPENTSDAQKRRVVLRFFHPQ